MHQRVQPAGHEPVVDEYVFFDGHRRVAALEIAGTIAVDARPQRQILRASRRLDRIGLHETQPVDCPFERGRDEQAAADGKTANVVEAGHASAVIAKVASRPAMPTNK